MNVAQLAADETTSVPVTVFDSRQLSLGTGFLVETAAKLAQAGSSLPQILGVLNEQIKRTHVFAALDTLNFLRRCGRMNGVISSIGELLQIKPIITMVDGQSSVERLRTRAHAVKRLLEQVHEYSPFEKLGVIHTDAAGRAQELLHQIKDLLPGGEIWFEQINPVLGVHVGPGVVGFACVSSV